MGNSARAMGFKYEHKHAENARLLNSILPSCAYVLKKMKDF